MTLWRSASQWLGSLALRCQHLNPQLTSFGCEVDIKSLNSTLLVCAGPRGNLTPCKPSTLDLKPRTLRRDNRKPSTPEAPTPKPQAPEDFKYHIYLKSRPPPPPPPPAPGAPPTPGPRPALLPAVPHNRNEPMQTRGREDDGA